MAYNTRKKEAGVIGHSKLSYKSMVKRNRYLRFGRSKSLVMVLYHGTLYIKCSRIKELDVFKLKKSLLLILIEAYQA